MHYVLNTLDQEKTLEAVGRTTKPSTLLKLIKALHSGTPHSRYSAVGPAAITAVEVHDGFRHNGGLLNRVVRSTQHSV